MTTLTIRRSTPEERREKFPSIVPSGHRIRIPKYVVVTVERDVIVSVFGLPQGGDTRAEAVFWAERCASKNGLDLILQDGWQNVVGELKDEA